MRSLSVASIARAATAVLALAACSKQPPAASGNHGSVKLAFQTLGQQQSALPLPQLCATCTIAQYSIDPVTGAHTSAGAPVVITETAPGQTASILGCIDSGAPGVNDWGYVVTATDWTMCPGQTLDPALAAYLSAHGFATFADFAATFAPQVATSAAELDCQAGLDTDAEVSVDVSIPIESQAGYVDISVNVNTSQVIVGCKEADLDSSTGDLNYGLADSNEATPPTLHGIIGLTQGAPLAQFDSQLHQATYTQTYAGQLAPPAAGTILLQSLMPDLATCAAGQELHGYAVPTCRTEAGTSADGTGTAYDTSALLSTVLLETSTFAAWGSLDSPTQLTFQTTSATPSTLAPGAAAVTYTGSSVHSNTLVTTTLGLANVPGCTRFDGLSASRDPGTFVVLCDTASGLGYALLTQSGGTWTATSVASISGLTGAQVACLNVFHHDSGCIDPAATPCAPPPPPACNGARTLTAIPTVNTTIEDIAIGSVTIGGTAYFFADWGAGGKLTSLDATGFHKLSDTNPGGPDHGWSGGLANLDGTLAFTAYDPDGRIRLYKYTPGDPLVTAPFVTVNTTQTGALLPTQTTIHTTQGYMIPQRGDDS
ncbi:MAG: hypothetical protein JST92_11935, partial [Deltaproteobacteria bacterium]|nr:hypothetical protein [Deltaproteobacteria bacterium]